MGRFELPRPFEEVTCHVGTVKSADPLVVESSPRQWDFAASLRLVSATNGSPIEDLPVMVSAEVVVETGELGCLLVGEDWNMLLGLPAHTVGPGTHKVDLIWERGNDGASLVFRNNGADNRPCVFTVTSVELVPVSRDPFGYMTRIQDVLEPGERRLDLSRLKRALEHPEQFHVDDKEVFDHLRRKWSVVQAGRPDRRTTRDLLGLSTEELRDVWTSLYRESTTGDDFAVRGWYHTLYRDVLRGKKVLEIGSGMGIDGIEFARHGAVMTFVDIVEDNLSVMQRLCEIFGVQDARFTYLERLASLDSLDNDYDVVWCCGALINAPFQFSQRGCAAIVGHLKRGGRWIELAYPRERWLREGMPPFREWGAMTDGEGTPWVEWYDLPRLLQRLAPMRFEPVLRLNFHDDDFNWFDLVRLQ